MDPVFFTGMVVMCLDNEGLENHLRVNECYTVRETSHRGALIKIKGVPFSLAASRFTPLKTFPPVDMEVVNAGN